MERSQDTIGKTATEMTFSLGEYLRPNSHKVAMSIPELVKETNAFSTKNRPGCKATLQKSQPKDLFLEYNVKCDLKTSDPAGHTVRIHFDLSQVKDETTANKLDVKVSCTCPAFLYWGGQWNSHARDALEGEPRPLLTAPMERLDLRGKFIICKHLAVVCDRILPAVQHNIQNILRERRVEERAPKLPPTKENLTKKQEDMKKRQDVKKLRDRRNKIIQKKLLEGLRKREEEQPGVIQRDEPATPGEKAKIPSLPPEPVAGEPTVTEPTAPTPKAEPTPPKKPVVKRDPIPATTPESERKIKEKLLEKENNKLVPETPKAVVTKSPKKDEKKPSSVDKLLEKERNKRSNRSDLQDGVQLQ